MTEAATPRDVAAAWQPQRPGRRAASEIPNAIVEPDWGGMRAVAALEPDAVALFAGGPEALPLPDELARSLIQSFTALGAVVEGHITAPAAVDRADAPPPPRVERPPILFPSWTRRRRPSHIDAELREREHRAAVVEQAIRESLARGEPHVFVATDLLMLDDQPTLGLPLLERKRLLESILVPSGTVRVSAYVQASSARTVASWGALGFVGLSYRGSNSRYLAGEENPDWALVSEPARRDGARTGP
jgi:ATP-dependent DNA ligase